MKKSVVIIIALVVLAVVVIPLLGRMIKGQESEKVETTPDPLRAALSKAVSVDIDQSPDGGRLTVQYAVMAVCDAAGIRYQFDKSQRLGGEDCKRFIASVHVSNSTAEKAITDILSPVSLKFDVDENGLYLYK